MNGTPVPRKTRFRQAVGGTGGALFTIYDIRFTIWMLARYARDMRSEYAAEFLEQGKLLAEKRPESRHAEPAALLNRQWFVILMTCFLHPEETHGKWVE